MKRLLIALLLLGLQVAWAKDFQVSDGRTCKGCQAHKTHGVIDYLIDEKQEHLAIDPGQKVVDITPHPFRKALFFTLGVIGTAASGFGQGYNQTAKNTEIVETQKPIYNQNGTIDWEYKSGSSSYIKHQDGSTSWKY